MIIIGEKINGTRKAIARAIRERDAAFIQDLAKSQAGAGSNYLDVNAGTAPEREAEDMAWLVGTIQEVCDTPLCLDSAILNPNDRNLRAVMLASEMLMGKDRFCQNFSRAVRAGKIGDNK